MSFAFGLRAGSLDKNPKINKEIKSITVILTNIFKANILPYKIKSKINTKATVNN